MLLQISMAIYTKRIFIVIVANGRKNRAKKLSKQCCIARYLICLGEILGLRKYQLTAAVRMNKEMLKGCMFVTNLLFC